MAFNIQKAREDGKTDTEIANYLAGVTGFKIDKARAGGKSDRDIAEYLSLNATPPAQSRATAAPADPDVPVIGADIVPDETGIGQTLGNVAAGAIRGAGSIGATIIAPYDIAQDYLAGKGLSLESNRQRREDIDAALKTMGAQPESLAYKGGKIGAEIAGTAGAGGALGNLAARTGLPPAVGLALKTGGFSTGGPAAATVASRATDAALRLGAGAATGATQATLVNPEDAVTGAAFGAAMPVGVKIAGEAGKAVKSGAGKLAAQFLGASTGAGAEAVKAAYEAGKQGSREFLDNMRGKVDFSEVVQDAKGAVDNLAKARSAEYRSGFVNISQDKTILPMKAIDDALDKIKKMATFKGVKTSNVADDTLADIQGRVDEWKALNPADYHTPEGFDALKKYVGELRDKTQPRTKARTMVDSVYQSIHGTITKQAPVYAKVMRDYHEASNAIKEIEKTLSLGEKASADTAVRKLQSIMRNNAQTSYGNRIKLLKKLEDTSGKNLSAAIAGQSMSSPAPRGMSGAIEKAAVLPATVAAALSNPPALAAMLAAAPLTSPRLVGESAYGLGRLAGGAGRAAEAASNPLFQLPLRQQQAIGAAARAAPLVILSNQKAQR